MIESIDWMAEFLSIIIPGPNRKLRKIKLILFGHETYDYNEALNQLAKLSQNNVSIWVEGGLLVEGAFRQFCLVNKALKRIYVNSSYDDRVVDDMVSVVEDASQCSNLEELVIECGEFNTRSERITEASRELRKRGVDILVGRIQYNF